MSVQRYWPTSSHGGMILLVEGSKGAYVKGEDYEALEAEVERLRADLEIAREGQRCECSTEDMCRFAQEREDARAEVERLSGALRSCRTSLTKAQQFDEAIEVERLEALVAAKNELLAEAEAEVERLWGELESSAHTAREYKAALGDIAEAVGLPRGAMLASIVGRVRAALAGEET